MDPKATLLEVRQCLLVARFYPQLGKLLGTYWTWRSTGGFEPSVTVYLTSETTITLSGDKYARLLARNVGRPRHELPVVITASGA